MHQSFDIPILLLTFNRPETTSILLDNIQKINPSKLYIFSDGPRHLNSADILNVQKTRFLLDSFNTNNCKVSKFYSENNIGCGLGVSGAINWVFEKEQMAIILEDDCVPDPTFFNFCRNMLIKFENNFKIMHISGSLWNEEFKRDDCDFFFSHIGHIWGWATWKRAWEKYDYHMKSWNEKDSSRHIREIYKNRLVSQFWIDMFNHIYLRSSKHTWDIQWQYALFHEAGLAVVPSVNLISNIGAAGMHTQTASKDHFRGTKNWNEKNELLCAIEPSLTYEIYHIKNHFLKDYSWRAKLKIYISSYLNTSGIKHN